MTTEAGKRLRQYLGAVPDLDVHIAAIEAEARADERARLRERVEGLDDVVHAKGVSRAAVLAILEEEK